jgi:TPP-dependent pyruvate/acetoin dehydrogenase alpha subunit
MSVNNRITKVRSIEPAEFQKFGLSKDRLASMLETLVRIRRFEEMVEELHLVRGLLIGAAHLCNGQEAVATGVISALKPEDLIISSHRGHGHAIAKQIPVNMIMAELFGKMNGVCKGLGGSMHVPIYVEKGGLYASAIVGSQIPIAVGAGLAVKYKKQGVVVVCFFGDGAVNTGAFHEGLNMAPLLKVPVILVCENNQFAMSTRVNRSVAARSIAERAAVSYNMPTFVANGNDVLAVYNATLKAIEKIEKEGGPVFMECPTYRMKGHSVHRQPKRDAEIEAWEKKDPIKMFSKKLLDAGVVTENEINKIREKIDSEIKAAVDLAVESPTLPFEELEKLVYAGGKKE